MFCTQDNQFFSPALPGTREKLNEELDSPLVKWKITTIRAVRQPDAIKQWASNTDFQKFCLKEAGKKKVGEAFQELTDEEKLARWATSLKESLPPLIFGARDFDETPLKKDKTKTMKRRVLAGIHLSGAVGVLRLRKSLTFEYCTVCRIAVPLQRDYDHTAKSGGTSAKSKLSALGLH